MGWEEECDRDEQAGDGMGGPRRPIGCLSPLQVTCSERRRQPSTGVNGDLHKDRFWIRREKAGQGRLDENETPRETPSSAVVLAKEN